MLGPLLFLIYINDIHNSPDKLSFYLFADDTNMLYADKNLKSLEETVNNELLKVSEWLNANKLTPNIKKSNDVIFRPYQRKLSYSVNIQMFDNSTHTHIEYVALKISKIIGLNARLRYFVPLCTLLNIYRSLIFPYMSYGLSTWNQAAKTRLQKLLVLQKTCPSLMYFSEPRAHPVSLFITSNILPKNMLCVETVSSLMHDVSGLSVPSNISDHFTNVNEIHTHKTRSSSSGHFYIKSSSLSLNQRSFTRFGAKLWNF